MYYCTDGALPAAVCHRRYVALRKGTCTAISSLASWKGSRAGPFWERVPGGTLSTEAPENTCSAARFTPPSPIVTCTCMGQTHWLVMRDCHLQASTAASTYQQPRALRHTSLPMPRSTTCASPPVQ